MNRVGLLLRLTIANAQVLFQSISLNTNDRQCCLRISKRMEERLMMEVPANDSLNYRLVCNALGFGQSIFALKATHEASLAAAIINGI